jgi:hypothetical protein
MWVQVKSASNLIVAEMWKELFEGEGIPTRVLPEPKKKPGSSTSSGYRILVSQERAHVVEEVLRKL